MVQSSDHLGATLFDSIQSSLLAAAEIGGNKLLALDETALHGCSEMQGYCIAINITDLDYQLYCHPGSWGLRLSRNPPTREVDATISGRLMALVNLAAENDKLSTSIREQVSFHGNVTLAQKVQGIFAELDIDWKKHWHSTVVMCSRSKYINGPKNLVSGCSTALNPYYRPAVSICAKKPGSVRLR